jgi:drug/metabolite transporter (DMT)-like permease
VTYRAGVLTLIVITMVWGTTFVVVKDALDTISVPLLLALRFSLAAACFAWVRLDRRAIRPALALGLLAFVGFATQTIGLSITTASNAAFITGLAVVLVPAVGALWFRDRVPGRVVLASVVATIGLALLTGGGGGGINAGDVWVLATAVAYALYIVYLGRVARSASVMSLAGLQHLPMAALAWIWAAPDLPTLPTVPPTTFLAIAYLAVVATAVVAVAQVYAQRVVSAPIAAIIFVLEPVFAATLAAVVLGEVLGASGWLGGALVVVAMLIGEARVLRTGRRPRRGAA